MNRSRNGDTRAAGSAGADRTKRLAEALRANLKRRKDQARAQGSTGKPDSGNPRSVRKADSD